MARQQQQQPPQVVHPRILYGIENLMPYGPAGGKKLFITPCSDHASRRPVNRHSVQYLVDFLREGSHNVTELHIGAISLCHSPSDGGLEVLRDFLENDTALIKVILAGCHFGSEQEASQVLAAFHTNTTMRDLTILGRIPNLEGAALGACLSALLQNNSHLQRFQCSPQLVLCAQAIRAFQPGLRTNCTLKELLLYGCRLGDEGVRLIVDALLGNTSLKTLDIRYNAMTSAGLVHIARLLESTQLHNITFGDRTSHVLANEENNQRFLRALTRNTFLNSLSMHSEPRPETVMLFRTLESNTALQCLTLTLITGPTGVDQLIESLPRMKALRLLSLEFGWRFCLRHEAFLPALRQNTSLEELPEIDSRNNRMGHGDQKISAINTILARNRSLRRAKALLALQPRTRRPRVPIESKSGIWYMAMARMGRSGASAIFHILQTRPALLEKQLRQPQRTTATGSTRRHEANERDDNDESRSNKNGPMETSASHGGKRARHS